MAKTAWHAPNLHLRGKRTTRLSCGCCAVRDLRPILRTREVEREMRQILVAQLTQEER